MTLTLTDVKKIAQLVRLELAAGEDERTLIELNDFFALVAQMQLVNTDGIEPLAHPIEHIQETRLRLRDDTVTEIPTRDEYQRNAPATQDGLYLVPKVIE